MCALANWKEMERDAIALPRLANCGSNFASQFGGALVVANSSVVRVHTTRVQSNHAEVSSCCLLMCDDSQQPPPLSPGACALALSAVRLVFRLPLQRWFTQEALWCWRARCSDHRVQQTGIVI